MEPSWGGWRQGEAEAWLLTVFLPFWAQCGPQARAEYLRLHSPPDTEWAARLQVWAATCPG